MPKLTRLTLAKADILSHFANASEKVYSEASLNGLLQENREFWTLAERTKVSDFIYFLERQGKLKPLELRSEEYDRSIKRYSWGKASPLELALSIKSRAYLCHGTAVTLHGLTKLPLKTIYLNAEQSAKSQDASTLTQRGIDLAFSGPQRQSKLIYTCAGISIVMIAGKNTGRLGVEEITTTDSGPLQVTNLERTLIDIVVRPAYAGGISHVVKAYRAARERMSVDRLISRLKTLDYVYPYHQAIGYLMQKADYPEKSFNKLRAIGLNYDFYLAHGIQEPAYSKEWRLFHPKR
jgi:predicted transcriptional regulator of viral defense system